MATAEPMIREVTTSQGKPRHLTKTESAILSYLKECGNEPCTKAQIATALGRNVKTIDRLISNLRADGALVVEHRWATSGGQLANVYRITCRRREREATQG